MKNIGVAILSTSRVVEAFGRKWNESARGEL